MKDKIEIFFRFATALFLLSTISAIIVNTLTVYFVSDYQTKYITESYSILLVLSLFCGGLSVLIRNINN